MANLNAEFQGNLTRPGLKYDEEMSICLLESDLKMSKSRANLVSFDENGSNSVSLYERKKTLKVTQLTSWMNFRMIQN